MRLAGSSRRGLMIRGFLFCARRMKGGDVSMITGGSVFRVSIFFLCGIVSGLQPRPLLADSLAGPSSPHGVQFSTALSATLIDQSTNGPGQAGPEAAGFANGSPNSPNTPYDLFSSAPQVPGVAGVEQALTTATLALPKYNFSLTGGIARVDGSITNAAYWGENLLPPLNPHLGSTALPYGVTFPTHAGQDDASAVRVALLSGSAETADHGLSVRAGYFDLTQSDRFVFVQPALTSVNPAIAYAPAESLSPGLAGADTWQSAATALPLHGLDAVARRGNAVLEITSAALPSLPGDTALINMASLVVDHGEGTRMSAQYLHAATAGAPFTTTVPFGAAPSFATYPQGVLPVSTLSGQHQTVAGLREAFHLAPALRLDGIAEIGRSWYVSDMPDDPGSEKPGGYYHVGVRRTRHRATASLDLYRMEPRYATLILPYGAPENQWSATFAWPGQWLKSNYQLIDNSVLGVNRQGYRLGYALDKGPLEFHAEFVDLRQIAPETTATAIEDGFVDGYYLPQLPDSATLGRQKRAGMWIAWHQKFADVTLDAVDDTLSRPNAPGHPADRVAYDVPQTMLTFSRRVSPAVTAAAGMGRYAMHGVFSEPIDFAQRLWFSGLQIQETAKSALLLSFRRSNFRGTPIDPASAASPNFSATTLIVEQRLQL